MCCPWFSFQSLGRILDSGLCRRSRLSNIGYDTLDIQGLAFFPDFSWSETQDHSKWGIAVNTSAVCFGDINRMTTQYVRGGGTVCWQDTYLSMLLRKATTGTDSCKQKLIWDSGSGKLRNG
jgi:hypothetical protein